MRRRSYESGHSPKFLVVIDDTPECDRAVYFASRRALRTGASVDHAARDRDRTTGISNGSASPTSCARRRTRRPNAVLDRHAARASSITGIMPERVIREGEKTDEMLKLIDDDEDIAILVLAAATGKEGPGPLVSSLGQDRRRLSDPGRDRARAT